MSLTTKFDNKQLIHIGTEIVVLLGVTFYFNSKNKKLLGHIEDLSQRIEEQEDQIQKLENSFLQLSKKMEMLVQQTNSGLSQLGQNINEINIKMNGVMEKILAKNISTKKSKEKINEQLSSLFHTQPPLEEVKEEVKVPKIYFADPPRVNLQKEEKKDNYKQVYEPNEESNEEKDDDDDDENESEEDSYLDDEIREELNDLIKEKEN